jgi:tRNA (guanine-N7-)-methyltransferase
MIAMDKDKPAGGSSHGPQTAGRSSRRSRVRIRPSGNPPEEARAFYGRRKGKTLRPLQTNLVESLLPGLSIDPAALPADPRALFETHVSHLRLEVGFGSGEHLVAEALRERHVGFLGCEPFINGVARAVQSIAEIDLDNVRLYPGEAGPLIDALPDACLAGVDVLYPDPWPKWRHRKRRFVSQSMLVRLARVMQPGAELHFATDIDDYAGWVLARIARSSEFEWPAQRSQDWREPWSGWTQTRYEAKARREGRNSAYLTFVRR